MSLPEFAAIVVIALLLGVALLLSSTFLGQALLEYVARVLTRNPC